MFTFFGRDLEASQHLNPKMGFTECLYFRHLHQEPLAWMHTKTIYRSGNIFSDGEKIADNHIHMALSVIY